MTSCRGWSPDSRERRRGSVNCSDAPAALAALAVPFMLLALAYGWLMFRGPFERDLKRHAASLAPRQ